MDISLLQAKIGNVKAAAGRMISRRKLTGRRPVWSQGRARNLPNRPAPPKPDRPKIVTVQRLYMKALICTRYGTPDDLEIADIAEPKAGPGEAVVKIHAAALNFFDTLIIAGKYQFKPAPPF